MLLIAANGDNLKNYTRPLNNPIIQRCNNPPTVNNLKNYTRPLNNPIIQRCNNPRKLQRPVNNPNYHIFCCNIFVFACPIIAESQWWLFAPGQISGQISVFALIYPYLPSYIRICPRIQLPVSAQWSQSTRKDDAWKYV